MATGWFSKLRRRGSGMARNGAPGDDRFLVLGCQRSGTTLVGMMLEAHPLVRYFGEEEEELHPHGRHTRLLDLAAMRDLRLERPEVLAFAANRDTHRWREFANALPGLRFVWVERDVRQVVASMVVLRADGSSWASRFGQRELSKLGSATGDAELAGLLDKIDASPEETRQVQIGALVWAVKRRQRVRAAEVVGDRLQLIQYDRVVAQPEKTMADLLEFLELPWSERVVNHQDHALKSTRRPGGADATRPVDTVSLDKWANLSNVELQAIDGVLGLFPEEISPP